jgi:hypothetical protein
VHPLGSGEHFAAALAAAGVAARAGGVAWTVAAGDARAAVDVFFTCAREPAETGPGDQERLDDDGVPDRLSYEAYWEDGALVVTLTRQFTLREAGEDEPFLDRLLLELRSRAAPPGTPESDVLDGTGGSEAGAADWEARVRADPAFAAALAGGPVDAVAFDQTPV